jgi:hypothetical protein
MGLKLLPNGDVIDEDDVRVIRAEFYEHMRKRDDRYEPVDYIAIRVPGNRDYASRPVTDADKERFPKEWEAYQAGKGAAVDGTPLTALPGFKMFFGQEFAQEGIKTVEELAACDECPVKGLEDLHKRAKIYVRAMELENEGAEIHQLGQDRGLNDNDQAGRTNGSYKAYSGVRQERLA